MQIYIVSIREIILIVQVKGNINSPNYLLKNSQRIDLV